MSIENLTGKSSSKKSCIRKKQQGIVEDIRYYGTIPDDILGEMTPEIIEQYYLWDEVAKKEVERFPWLLLPLIQEVFHKAYPENAEIRLIATEYVVRRIHNDGGSTLNSIFADIAVSIESRHELVLPRSVILYLNDTDNMPAEEICLIRFADGTTHEYRVPVMNVQSYTTEMIEKKHLNMLIPFLPIRFRKYLNRRKNGKKQPLAEVIRKDLTEFIRECIMIIDREKENGTLTDIAGKEMIELLDVTCGYLLKNEPELKKEVHGIMRPIIMTQMERAEYEIKIISDRLTEEKNRIEAEMQRIMQKAENEKKMHSEGNENAIRKLMEKGFASGQNRQEVKESIQDIFSLSEAEAEEKMEKYWVQEDE